ncbi:hypothetical protein BDY19DRAFT_609178 [Irpex rosettiformis]|uniref:Uncharacterized protein n=1 Tax=Irpex rosettiformis TaxID=378272 RepID=A0ACB8TPN6_9APHY|nr:hypothetical protein BDY19DRAFT_609178 [Irpex rosettiformis]
MSAPGRPQPPPSGYSSSIKRRAETPPLSSSAPRSGYPTSVLHPLSHKVSSCVARSCHSSSSPSPFPPLPFLFREDLSRGTQSPASRSFGSLLSLPREVTAVMLKLVTLEMPTVALSPNRLAHGVTSTTALALLWAATEAGLAPVTPTAVTAATAAVGVAREVTAATRRLATLETLTAEASPTLAGTSSTDLGHPRVGMVDTVPVVVPLVVTEVTLSVSLLQSQETPTLSLNPRRVVTAVTLRLVTLVLPTVVLSTSRLALGDPSTMALAPLKEVTVVRRGPATPTAVMAVQSMVGEAKEATVATLSLVTLEMLTAEASPTLAGTSSTDLARRRAGMADTATAEMLSVATVATSTKQIDV